MIGNRARLAIPRDDLIPLRVLCKRAWMRSPGDSQTQYGDS